MSAFLRKNSIDFFFLFFESSSDEKRRGKLQEERDLSSNDDDDDNDNKTREYYKREREREPTRREIMAHASSLSSSSLLRVLSFSKVSSFGGRARRRRSKRSTNHPLTKISADASAHSNNKNDDDSEDENDENEEKKQRELFPSSLLITPELLPDSSELRKADYLVEEMLTSIRRGVISVNQARDMFSEGSFSMVDSEKLEAAERIIKHMLQSKEYAPNIRNMFVGCLRSLAQSHNPSAISFGEAFIREIPDERAMRTLIQAHGKLGNFSKPIELLIKGSKIKVIKKRQRHKDFI